MVEYEMMVVVSADALEEALIERFGEDTMCSFYSMANVLFDDNYNNDSYKRYWFGEDEEYTGASWQNEKRIRIRNQLNSILREEFPGHDAILVDVSW